MTTQTKRSEPCRESRWTRDSILVVCRLFMRAVLLVVSLLSVAALNNAAVAQETEAQRQLTFVLAGDSTVTDDAGWGKGFAELLNDSARCINLAQHGQSSRSYRTRGWWQQVLEARPDYVLIQFGHNDQPGKGVERESAAETDFREHLRRYVAEAREAGIRPVLVTSLTRRAWNSDGTIQATLHDYATATLAVAQELDVPVIDLHSESIKQCEAIGSLAFRALEPMTLEGADHTHLNTEGGRAVGALVADLLLKELPELETAFSQERITAFRLPQPIATTLQQGDYRLIVSDDAIQILRGERSVLTYNINSPSVPQGISSIYQRSGMIHPIHTPGGSVVTAAFPFDHPHQHGLFSAWVNTTWNDRSIDFWNLAKGEGRVLHQRVVETLAGEDQIGFIVDLVHRAEQAPIVDVLWERWKVTVRESDEEAYVIELESTQTALTSSPLHVHEYHYGGIAFRGPVEWLLPSDSDLKANPEVALSSNAFLTDQGADRISGNGQKARWVLLHGKLNERDASVVIAGHPENFRAPQSTRLHPTKPYFAFAPCVEGEFVIDQQHPYHARYLILACDQVPDANWIEAQLQLHWPEASAAQ